VSKLYTIDPKEQLKKTDILDGVHGGTHILTFEDGRRLTFIHNPKTGGMSIHAWFIKNFPNCRHDMIEGHKTISGSESMFKGGLGFTFSIMRNPYDWYVSRWTHYVRSHPDLPQYHFADFLHVVHYGFMGITPKSLGRGVHFSTFIENVDLVLKFEDLKKEFVKIQKITNCFEPLDIRNATKKDGQHYSFFYNDELRDLVYNRHKDFFDLTGYEFEDKRGGRTNRRIISLQD